MRWLFPLILAGCCADMVAIPQATIGRQISFRDSSLNQELDRLYFAIQQKQFNEKNVDVKSLGAAIARADIAHPNLTVYKRLDLLGYIECKRPGTDRAVIYARVDGDDQPRFQLLTSGVIRWGNGTDAYDTILYRSAADTLRTPDRLVAAGDLLIGDAGNAITEHFSVTKTWNPGTVTANTTATTTQSVTGASLGDTVVIGPPNLSNEGWLVSGYVSSTNNVSITIYNLTGSDRTPGSGSWRIDVWKH